MYLSTLSVGKKGNLTERVMPVVLCIVVSFASLLGTLYLLLWQVLSY